MKSTQHGYSVDYETTAWFHGHSRGAVSMRPDDRLFADQITRLTDIYNYLLSISGQRCELHAPIPKDVDGFRLLTLGEEAVFRRYLYRSSDSDIVQAIE